MVVLYRRATLSTNPSRSAFLSLISRSIHGQFLWKQERSHSDGTDSVKWEGRSGRDGFVWRRGGVGVSEVWGERGSVRDALLRWCPGVTEYSSVSASTVSPPSEFGSGTSGSLRSYSESPEVLYDAENAGFWRAS